MDVGKEMATIVTIVVNQVGGSTKYKLEEVMSVGVTNFVGLETFDMMKVGRLVEEATAKSVVVVAEDVKEDMESLANGEVVPMPMLLASMVVMTKTSVEVALTVVRLLL